jgi:hypothetical protein
MSKDDDILRDLLLLCPETAEELEVSDVETDEDEGTTTVYVQGVSAKWKHIIKTEEM